MTDKNVKRHEIIIGWAIIAGFIVLAIILIAGQRKVQQPIKQQTVVVVGHISSSSCIRKIHDITLYDTSRLRINGQTDSYVSVSYLNDHGRVHGFRCFGPSGNVQIFAQGAGIWLDM